MFGMDNDDSAPTKGKILQLEYLCKAFRLGDTFPTMSFGYFFPPDKSRRIQSWLDEQPYDWEFKPAFTRDEATLTIYVDWLHWSNTDAILWLRKLDTSETRFRAAGLQYHRVPHQLRHSTFILPGSQIEQLVLSRLSNVLEKDTPRHLQTFFVPWMTIYKTAVEVLDQIEALQHIDNNTNVDLVRANAADTEMKLFKLEATFHNLKIGLEWLEKAVQELADRSVVDGSEALAAKFSREGSLFRRWIQTFLEVEKGVVGPKAAYTEVYIQQVLEKGVGLDGYWSKLVDRSDLSR
ncbi:hypothetical protein T440DRAFT_222759 [Plenodomus tracheiphilus IPT5]|uniref:Uncharacterized protein n=1 Tax=Plenodomus tracheiphilus IPT5 TaxID=1408161 RepID=A0A6A7ATX2_9PLEO|nr:hypothetical protein T440DRAFT_222759 [Plenodomus tracheiphilus IPT5]